MSLFSRDADVIAIFQVREKPKPCKLQFVNEEGEDCILPVEKIERVREKRDPWSKTYIYDCYSWRGYEQLHYELLYSPSTYRWVIQYKE